MYSTNLIRPTSNQVEGEPQTENPSTTLTTNKPEVSVNVTPRQDPTTSWMPIFDILQSGSSAILLVLIILAMWAKGSVSKMLDKHIGLLDTMKESILKNTGDLAKLNEGDAANTKAIAKLSEDVASIKEQSQDSMAILYRLAAKEEKQGGIINIRHKR